MRPAGHSLETTDLDECLARQDVRLPKKSLRKFNKNEVMWNFMTALHIFKPKQKHIPADYFKVIFSFISRYGSKK